MILARYEGRWARILEATLVLGLIAYFGRPVLVPIAVALVLTVLLMPVVGALEDVRVPTPLAAAIVVGGLLALSGYGAWRLSGPALDWLDRAPATLLEARLRLERVQSPVQQVTEAAEEVERIATPGDAEPAQRVEVESGPSLSSRILDGAWRFVTAGVIVAVLVFFLLSTRQILFRKLLRMMADHEQRARAADAALAVRSQISVHLATVAFVNVVLGVAVGAALWALDFPSPALWGAMAGFLNFVPYLGSMFGVALVAVVGLTNLDGTGEALAAAGAYASLTALEGMVVTPALLGRRLRINPVAVLLGLLVLGFLWGIAGALLAVPFLVATRAVAEHHARGEKVAVLLGR